MVVEIPYPSSAQAGVKYLASRSVKRQAVSTTTSHPNRSAALQAATALAAACALPASAQAA